MDAPAGLLYEVRSGGALFSRDVQGIRPGRYRATATA